MKGLRLTARGEAVLGYLEAAAALGSIALALGAIYSTLTMIGY